MAASCFCGARRAGRGQFVKLVFPGGHVELLDRPVQAAEVMARHPRFCVARPDVFREPAGAVAAPDTMLHLGRKYYVVPKSTVRRLLKYSSSHSASGGGSGSVSLRRHLQASSASGGGHDRGSKVGGGKKWFGWAVGTAATGDSGDQAAKAPRRTPDQEGASRGSTSEGEMVRRVCVKVAKEKGKGANGGSPGRRRRRPPSPGESASYSWQPSLHSITEE
ncbi:hypothetical protein BRADI_1g37579v3 [Brachypodium distachyon]|uniref:DUF4228 domain-containing protein n=1 Tax=Brachypodium distachyon TaxID=15368 RepID=A0A0Q3H639_BRADI|nr:hypothetical protein BRADI_1g37579v3 [Brachypodium distachyon]